MQQKTGKSIQIGLIFALCAGFPTSGVAETKDFTFKRIKVDPNRKGPRMNIQIQPGDQDEFLNPDKSDAPEAPPEPTAKPPADLQDWFWADVSPKLDQADFKRMDLALVQLQKDQARKAKLQPSAASIKNLIAAHGKSVLLASLDAKVSPALLLAVMSVESGGKVDAQSSAGAQGLMQLIPATAERFKVSDPNDPIQNIKGGAAYLEWLLAEFQHDPLLALAGYNAGENAVKDHAGVPPYPETRAYVPKVVAAWEVVKGFCKTPPPLVSDPCVFDIK